MASHHSRSGCHSLRIALHVRNQRDATSASTFVRLQVRHWPSASGPPQIVAPMEAATRVVHHLRVDSGHLVYRYPLHHHYPVPGEDVAGTSPPEVHHRSNETRRETSTGQTEWHRGKRFVLECVISVYTNTRLFLLSQQITDPKAELYQEGIPKDRQLGCKYTTHRPCCCIPKCYSNVPFRNLDS